jgi:hypothetical protein
VSTLAEPLVRAVDGPRSATWVLDNWSFLGAVGLLVLIFLLFPTGRLPAHGWRWVARTAVVLPVLLMVAVLFSSDPDEPALAGPWPVPEGAADILGGGTIAGYLAMFLLVLAGMVSLFVRFHRAGPVQRRQLTWFLYATALIVLLLGLDGVVGRLPGGLIGAALYAVAFTLLPVAVGIAVFRYRLYEIDRIVSRTVSYGLLTGVLVALYVVLVRALGSLLEPLTGTSSLAVAGSTLAVAAAFDPVRRRLQAAVDRRFDRARYDAARAVDAFAVRLRDQIDLDEVTGGLRDTVVDTVAPTRVAVWLRTPAPPRRPAR